ncbi:MAG: hypothetical protein V1822_00940 [Candidatus Micrarchaeota archaeon]
MGNYELMAKRAVKTVKFEIISDEDMFRRIEQKILLGKYQGEDLLLAFEDMETFSKFFTKERLRLLRAIKSSKPKSLYALAKTLKRDFKNVQTDAKFLAANKLIRLEKYKVGKMTKLRPTTSLKKIELEMAL